MKKIILLAACAAFTAASAMAQMSLVKDLSKLAGSGNPQDLATVLEQIQPALVNAESAGDVLTWYTAGKAAFGIYDKMLAAKMMQQPVDDGAMAELLSAGFEFYQKALPLDTVIQLEKDGTPKIDKKTGLPKVKTKYSDEILGSLTSHMGDIADIGNSCLQSEKWDMAASAFHNFAEISTSPFAKKQGIVPADSTLAQVRFFEGYAFYQAKQYEPAYFAFTKAMKLGYKENNVEEFNNSSLANLIQVMLDAKDYAKAYTWIDNAIANDPNDPVLYDMKGFAKELETEGVEEAIPFYKQACQLGPDNSSANYDMGRCLYLRAQKIIDENLNMSTQQLAPKVKPIYDEAMPYLQKAVSLNGEQASKAQRIIDDINYKLEQMK